MAAAVDTFTGRPRTANDQYTLLTEEQMQNIKKAQNTSPFFHTIKAEPSVCSSYIRTGGRAFMDRYCKVTNEHLLRGTSGSQAYGWIGDQHQRMPPEDYNTCRGRASVRWGPNKTGERTRSHFFGEDVDRYTNIDMYRRNPTCYRGRVVMDCGRPADGYYAQKYPSRTTWFGTNAPLNRTAVMESVYQKTLAEHQEVQKAEELARRSRVDQWPEFSEYTEKFTLHSKTAPKLTGLQEKKKHLEAAQTCA